MLFRSEGNTKPLYVSNNQGGSFSLINSLSLPNSGVSYPEDIAFTKNIMFITKGQVYYSKDNGTNFSQLDKLTFPSAGGFNYGPGGAPYGNYGDSSNRMEIIGNRLFVASLDGIKFIDIDNLNESSSNFVQEAKIYVDLFNMKNQISSELDNFINNTFETILEGKNNSTVVSSRQILSLIDESLATFNNANISNLNAAYQNPAWDPGRKYSLPWQSGFAGFGWNKAKLKDALGTDKLTSMDQFFDPKLKGQVVVLSELRDTIPLVLAWQGNDPTNFGDAEFQKAIDYLQTKVDDGHIQAFTGNDYATALENGDVIAVIGWSGDLGQLGDEYGFDLPESGGSIFVDNLIIPAGAENKTNAEKLINYFYDPAVAARVAAYVQYISPVNGAAEELMKTDPKLAENPLIFPPDELLKRAYSAMPFTPEQAAKYNEIWAKLIGN